jgi:hypothetical protein
MKLFGAGKPDHAMADRKNARRILDELPAQDLKAVEELAHWHESVGAAEGFKPEERAQLLAMIDEAAQPRLRKLEQEYLAAARAPRGSRAQENLLWARVHDYWRQAGQAYARAIESKALPELVVGALRSLAQQLKWQQLRYGPVDAALWGRINRIFALAEAGGIAAGRPEFLKAALLGASSMNSRLAPEIELAERLIAALAPAFVLAKAPAAELPYWIDLGQPMAPARSTQPPQPAAGLRFFGPGAALGTLQAMIKSAEKSGRVPAELKLGTQYDAESVLAVMRHLATYWAPVPPERKHKRHSVASQLKVVHGFSGVLEALGGDSDSLDFGGGASESWRVENVSAGGFGALVPQAKSDWLKVGALVAAQPDGTGTWFVGTVRRVSKVSSQETRVGVETLSRAPALSHFAIRNAGELQGVLLPAAVPGEAAVALRAGVYAPGENLETTIGGRQHVYLPQGVSERGEDYEIVKFKELVRES